MFNRTKKQHQIISYLKADLKMNAVNDLTCYCGDIEDAIHYLLECQLYYNQILSLSKDLINTNIQITIETLLFGNYIHVMTKVINFFFIESFFFLSNRQQDFDTPKQQL